MRLGSRRHRQLTTLNNRWPNDRVTSLFHAMAPMLVEEARKSHVPSRRLIRNVVEEYFGTALLSPLLLETARGNGSQHNPVVVRTVEELTALLGMLVHVVPREGTDPQQFRARRVRTRIPTYPTPPALGEIMAEFVTGKLLRGIATVRCRSTRQADAFAKRLLGFRIIDTSVEAGHLLLQFVLAVVRKVDPAHRLLSAERYRLYSALFERLYNECLWGVDKNPYAVEATRQVLSILANSYGVQGCKARNIICADSLTVFRNGSNGGFDAVINNPPWGETIDGNSRHTLRSYSSAQHRAESYVAFTHNSVDLLSPGGVFGFVLPSQMLGASNAAGLRELLADRCQIDELILLPRTAFPEATVRGTVLLGRKTPLRRTARWLNVTRFPTAYDLTKQRTPVRHKVSSSKVTKLRGATWTGAILNGDSKTAFLAPVIRLGNLAFLSGGVRPYGVGKGTPRQTAEVVADRPFTFAQRRRGLVPACRGADVHPFEIHSATTFLKLGPWLAWAGPHRALMETDRVFVRELCRRDGTVFAAAAPTGVVPLHSVLTVAPYGINVLRLTALLNSTIVAQYVRNNTASFTKVDFQKITIHELAEIPVPQTLVTTRLRRKMEWEQPSATAARVRNRIDVLARRLTPPDGRPQPVWEELRLELDAEVRKAYELADVS